MRTDRVEEVTVVADNQHGVFEVRQIVFKPHDGFKVEVVGRLVQQQVIRLSEEGACQQDTYFLLTAHVLHQRVVEFFRDTQAAQEGGGITFGIPAFHLGELLFQFRYADTVGIAEIRFCIQGVFLAHHLPKGGVSHQHCVHYGVFIKCEVVLTQYGKAFTRS